MNGLRVLITGGRAPCALDLARGFAARGAEVYAAECLEHPLCAASRAVKRSFRVPPPAQDAAGYAAALRDIVRSERIGLLLPTCEEIFYISEYRGSFGPDCRVLAPPLGTLRELHSKWAFIALCARLGFAVPETVRLGGESEAKIAGEFPRRPGEAAYILKPEFSRFSAGVSRHGTLDEARAEASRAGGSWVAQAFAGSEMLCTYGVAHEGRLLAHAAYRAPQTASGASVCFQPDADPAAREWVARFAERTNFSGQLSFDFIRTDEGLLLPIECNPRATSGVHLLLAPQAGAANSGSGAERAPDLLDALASPERVPTTPLDELVSGERVPTMLLDELASPERVPTMLLDELASPERVPTTPLDELASPERVPTTLLDALASPERVSTTIVANPARTPMLLLPMLASGLAQLRSPKQFARWLRDFRGSRDVLLRSGDAAVLPQAIRMMAEFRRRANALGLSMSEASVHDIGWNGDPIRPEDRNALRQNGKISEAVSRESRCR